MSDRSFEDEDEDDDEDEHDPQEDPERRASSQQGMDLTPPSDVTTILRPSSSPRPPPSPHCPACPGSMPAAAASQPWDARGWSRRICWGVIAAIAIAEAVLAVGFRGNASTCHWSFGL